MLHLGQGSPWQQDSLGDEGIENGSVEKDLGVLVAERLDMSWQCPLKDQSANHKLGYTKRNVANRPREVILTLYSTPVIPHLQCCIQTLELSAQEGHGPVEASAEEGHGDDQRAGSPLLCRKSESSGCSARRKGSGEIL